MRYAVIMAGGSGTRLWPMSRAKLPKQLIPFINGKSLLQLAFERLDGLIPKSQRYICANQQHAALIGQQLGLPSAQFFGEPIGRDTLNAVGLSSAIIGKRDPDAIISVFTADHVIEPIEQFQKIVERGFQIAEDKRPTLVTFGITPTEPATGFGYLQLGDVIDDSVRVVEQFKEKPDAATAKKYIAGGSSRYLWNSGMFIWRAATLLDCIGRYEKENFAGLMQIADAWDMAKRDTVLAEVFPKLKKISIDFAVMERASRDPAVRVAAVPMPLRWLDIGSWTMFAETCEKDSAGNALGSGRILLKDSRGLIVSSNDPRHLIATVGCENLIVIHTSDATLVCRKDKAEAIKDLHREVAEKFGDEFI